MKIDLGKLLGLDKQPEVKEATFVSRPLTAGDVRTWKGPRGTFAFLIQNRVDVADALRQNGAVVTDGLARIAVGGTKSPDASLVLEIGGKLYVTQAKVLIQKAPKMIVELRRRADATRIFVIEKTSKAQRKYYDFKEEEK